ncbi:hypothetical protein BKA69DRAFT_1090499 [Paraphysoderma sedebokerense]|nr:hypothetical protein BKA69DRAFT_1090499 [Paraphysoderma sedebokerense]
MASPVPQQSAPPIDATTSKPQRRRAATVTSMSPNQPDLPQKRTSIAELATPYTPTKPQPQRASVVASVKTASLSIVIPSSTSPTSPANTAAITSATPLLFDSAVSPVGQKLPQPSKTTGLSILIPSASSSPTTIGENLSAAPLLSGATISTRSPEANQNKTSPLKRSNTRNSQKKIRIKADANDAGDNNGNLKRSNTRGSKRKTKTQPGDDSSQNPGQNLRRSNTRSSQRKAKSNDPAANSTLARSNTRRSQRKPQGDPANDPLIASENRGLSRTKSRRRQQIPPDDPSKATVKRSKSRKSARRGKSVRRKKAPTPEVLLDPKVVEQLQALERRNPQTHFLNLISLIKIILLSVTIYNSGGFDAITSNPFLGPTRQVLVNYGAIYPYCVRFDTSVPDIPEPCPPGYPTSWPRFSNNTCGFWNKVTFCILS